MEDTSEDVNEFLLRIRELGDKRVKEDEDRARKLEEEILQGRKERQARRAGKHILPAENERTEERETLLGRWAFLQVTIACPASSPFPCHFLDMINFISRYLVLEGELVSL